MVVLGNLQTTGGGNINISAVGNVSIGTVNAGTGHVYLTSISGSILSSNGTALEITGATILKSCASVRHASQSASSGPAQRDRGDRGGDASGRGL